jgi:transketolase C-terminal domain/subunit
MIALDYAKKQNMIVLVERHKTKGLFGNAVGFLELLLENCCGEVAVDHWQRN